MPAYTGGGGGSGSSKVSTARQLALQPLIPFPMLTCPSEGKLRPRRSVAAARLALVLAAFRLGAGDGAHLRRDKAGGRVQQAC